MAPIYTYLHVAPPSDNVRPSTRSISMYEYRKEGQPKLKDTAVRFLLSLLMIMVHRNASSALKKESKSTAQQLLPHILYELHVCDSSLHCTRVPNHQLLLSLHNYFSTITRATQLSFQTWQMLIQYYCNCNCR